MDVQIFDLLVEDLYLIQISHAQLAWMIGLQVYGCNPIIDDF